MRFSRDIVALRFRLKPRLASSRTREVFCSITSTSWSTPTSLQLF